MSTSMFFLPLCGLLFCLFFCFNISCDSTALQDYINRPEPLYSFFEIESQRFYGEGYTGHVLNMTSQQWLTPEEVSRSVWWHYITIIIPDKINPLFGDTALIYATGGDNKQSPPNAMTAETPIITAITVPLGVISIVLFDIPNQPIVFASDPSHAERTEDHLIAWAWDMFIKNPSRPELLPRLPMVKAVVKCMDTVQTFAAKYGVNIERFLIAGASKRGWTTWLTGVIDDARIVGIIPIVMSALNFQPVIMHHYQSLGGWSFALSPYWVLNFTEHIGNPDLDPMLAVIDPFSYPDKLRKIPKLQIIGSGDPFFLPDDDNYWLQQEGLIENTHIRIMPNCEHSMAECIPSLAVGIQGWLAGQLYQDPSPPQFTWTINNSTGDIVLTPGNSGNITAVRMWSAQTLSKTRRDFRLLILGPNGKPTLQLVLWKSTDLSPQADGTYVASQPMPGSGEGWVGFYIEIQYASYQNTQYHFTTQVSILPRELPFPPCAGGVACLGKLV